MKKILLSVCAIFALSASLRAQIPNPSFECWNAYPGPPPYEEPCQWTSFNSSSAQGYPVFVFKTTDAHNGTYAIEVRTQGYTNPFPPYQALVDVGYTQTGTNYQNGPNGFPYTQRPSTFSAWVKYLPQGIDSAEIKIKLYKWSPTFQQPQDVAHAEFYVHTTDSVYHCVLKNFTYVPPFVTSGNPDTASVYISSSFQNNPTAGSIIKVDDIAFGNCTVGMPETAKENPELYVFPNPASDKISFSLFPAGADRIKLFEITGKMVAAETVNDVEVVMDLKKLKPGIYFSAVYDQDNKVIASRKFSIVR